MSLQPFYTIYIAYTNIFQQNILPVKLLKKTTTQAPTESAIERHRSLLQKIGIGFGFSDKETNEIVEQAYLSVSTKFKGQQQRFTTKIWLSKLMVSTCVYRISCPIFSQVPAVNASSVQYLKHKNYSAFQLPLSLRAVHILYHSIGFDENEIAEILNITPFQVRERLARAMAVAGRH